MHAVTETMVTLPVAEANRGWRRPSLSSVNILGGCLLVVFGAKIWLISLYGSATPFWDQWEEAVKLYKPYFDGSLHFSSLFDAHNDHRIFFSRVLALGLLLLERRWDPLLQMVVNASIHVAAIGVLLVMMTHKLSVRSTAAVAVFTAIFLAIPYGWENTIAGFQSVFYFYLLFVFLSVWLHSHSPAWSLPWISATALAVASYFNVSSGALTPVVLFGISVSQIIVGSRNSGYREWTGMVAQCLLALVMILFIPRLSSFDPAKAHSIEQFMWAFLWASAWPFLPAFAVVLHAPMIALTASLVKDRPDARDNRWIFFGLWLWLGLQFVSLAYGRAAIGVTASRYLDIFLVGLVLNFVAILRLLPERPRLSVSFLAGAWLFALSIGAAHEAVLGAAPDIVERHRTTDIETRNVRGYLTTGDFGFLNGKPLLEIPYPDANALRAILDMPEIHAILPATLIDDGVLARRSVVNLRDLLLSHGPLLVIVGIGLLFFGISYPRQEAAEAANRPKQCWKTR